jgi:hypothetical protein
MLLIFPVMFAGCAVFQMLGQCANPDVHFILADGYKGTFRVVLDEAHGVDPKLENGRYVFEIPSTAEIRVKTFDPFLRCHKENAAYKSGQKIPDADSNVPDDVIALRGGIGSGSRPVNGKNVGPIILTYVIGTAEDRRNVTLPTFTSEMPNVASSP